MKLTHEIILQKGFEKVNNSTYRKGNITLQNTYIHFGNTLAERLVNFAQGYKCCVDGKYNCNFASVDALDWVLKNKLK